MLNFQLRKSLNLGGKIIPKGFSNPLKPRVVKVLGVFSTLWYLSDFLTLLTVRMTRMSPVWMLEESEEVEAKELPKVEKENSCTLAKWY